MLFSIGGLLGFIVDAGIVQALVRVLGWNPYMARVLSFVLAASLTWVWNRNFTFAHQRVHRAAREWLRWMLVMMAGAVLNLGLYVVLLSLFALLRSWPAVAVAVGSAGAALVNFCAARAVVFGNSRNAS